MDLMVDVAIVRKTTAIQWLDHVWIQVRLLCIMSGFGYVCSLACLDPSRFG